MSAFPPTLTVWVPICYNGKILIWPGHDRDILSRGMTEQRIVDKYVNVYEGYRCCVLCGIGKIDLCSDSERRLGCIKYFQGANLGRERCQIASRNG